MQIETTESPRGDDPFDMNLPTSFSLAAAAALFLPTAASAQQPTPPPATMNPALAGDGVQIGVARQDGVTVSADGAVVTRNGTTEKLTKNLILPSGMTVRPDGIVIMSDKSEVPLRTTQILTFEGKIVPLSVDPRVNLADPRSNGPGTTPGGVGSRIGAMPGAIAATPTAISYTIPRGTLAVTGCVFFDSDGARFLGTLNPDGTLLLSNGTVMQADGSIRAASSAPDGTPPLGMIDSNGAIIHAGGATVALDRAVIGSNGQMLTPAAQNNTANPVPGLPRANANTPVQASPGAAAGRNANSPNNAGVLPPSSAAGGRNPNYTEWVNNPAISPKAGPGNRPGAAGPNQPGARSGTVGGKNSASGGGGAGQVGGKNGGGGASGAGGEPDGSGGSPR